MQWLGRAKASAVRAPLATAPSPGPLLCRWCFRWCARARCCSSTPSLPPPSSSTCWAACGGSWRRCRALKTRGHHQSVRWGLAGGQRSALLLHLAARLEQELPGTHCACPVCCLPREQTLTRTMICQPPTTRSAGSCPATSLAPPLCGAMPCCWSVAAAVGTWHRPAFAIAAGHAPTPILLLLPRLPQTADHRLWRHHPPHLFGDRRRHVL